MAGREPRYQEADLSKVRSVPIAKRANKVNATLLAKPPLRGRSFDDFLASLPDLLGAQNLRAVSTAIVAAVRAKKGVIVQIGGHVIKTGLGPLLLHMMRKGAITHLAMNSAASIHDFELAAFGGTSEDVAAGLKDGTFGMADETATEMNAAIATAHKNSWGMGEALGRCLRDRKDSPGREVSVLLGALELGVPVTVHAAIGTDITHQHPSADGAAIGATSFRDFRRLAASIPTLDEGGVVLNLGSAVIMPEVFLKALTVARNLNAGKPRRFVAADFDMIRHYRPRLNVVERPTADGGAGYSLTGQHEILVPLLVWSVDAALEAR
jgi:hypothetical protein